MSKYANIIELRICGNNIDDSLTALEVELNQPQPEKGLIKMKKEGNCLIVIIKSKDLSGLRALSNSFLYLLYSSISVLSEIEKKHLD